MNEILELLIDGHFITWNVYKTCSLSSKKSFEMAIYKLRKKGHDIKTLDEYGETVYYLKSNP